PTTLPATPLPYTTLFRSHIHHRRAYLLFQGFGFLRQVMGEFNETNNLAFRFADKLILGQSAAMDFTQQMADLLIQLQQLAAVGLDRKSTRLNSSHVKISY